MPKSRHVPKSVDPGLVETEGPWVHVENSENLPHDSWELVEESIQLNDSDPDIEKLDAEDLEDDVIKALENSSPKDRHLQKVMDKSSDFQIIDVSDEESSSNPDELLEAEILEAAKRNAEALFARSQGSDMKTLKYSQVVHRLAADKTSSDAFQQKPSFIKVSHDSPEKEVSPDSPEKEVSPEKVASSDKEVSPEKEDSDNFKREIVVSSNQAAVTANAEIVSAKADQEESFREAKSKKQKRKKSKTQLKSDKMDTNLLEDKKDVTPEPKVTEKKTSEKFMTYARSKEERDLSTLSVLLAKDQTIEDLTAKDESAGSEDLSEQNGSECLPQAIIEEVIEEAVDTVDADKSLEKDGAQKESKSSRRRKKQKDKMAKAIENFSNPSLLLENYEKTFEEEYKPPTEGKESDIDNQLCCSICLDLFLRPQLVQPCSHRFCEPCLKKLSTKTTTQVPCPMCRKVIQSCTLDKGLNSQITKSFPVEVAARNRADKKTKTKKTSLPKMELKPESKQKAIASAKLRLQAQKNSNPLNQSQMEKLMFVVICLISYVCTSVTIRAISYFVIDGGLKGHDTSFNYLFMLVVFCLYFYLLDKGIKKTKALKNVS